MAACSNSTATDTVLETLRGRGWSFGDPQHIKSLIDNQSAFPSNAAASAIADSVESELLNMDLKSIGARSLPDSKDLRRSSHFQGPKVLQIKSVRDISRSSTDNVSSSSSGRRLLRLQLSDGHSEVTAIEYSNIPEIPSNVVPGTKVRIENRVVVHNGILCLNRKTITILGGIVQSLYEEWDMNRKYSGFSRSSMSVSKGSDSGGPPKFEKLSADFPLNKGSAKAQSVTDYPRSTAKMAEPIISKSTGVDAGELIKKLAAESKQKNLDSSSVGGSSVEQLEKKPSVSEARPKEVVESIPIQNQAASQKLLQKMSHPAPYGSRSRGSNHRGKGRQEEHAVFTLDEWEKRKANNMPRIENKLPDTSRDEDIAWQLQNQLELEDSHAQGMHGSEAANIRLSMFSYERDGDGGPYGEPRGRGRGRGRGWGRGRGRTRGRGGRFD